MNISLRSCLTGLLSLLAVNCSHPSPGSRDSEVILFTTLSGGEYKISTVRPDGSHLEPFLQARPGRSYLFASGNSLRSTFVVLVHETNPAGGAEDHLYVYRPGSAEWRRLSVGDGYEASGAISPNDLQIVFMLAPKEPFGKLRLWTMNLKTGEVKRLTGEEGKDKDEWDQYPAWSPDAQEIAFIRLRRTDKGLTSTLMRIPSGGGQPTVFLGPEVGIGGFCYAPDSKHFAVLTAKGLEIIGTSEPNRSLILPWSRFSNYQFRAGGVKWFQTQNKIAFSIYNKQADQQELWTVSTDGRDSRRIYSQKAEILVLSSFIRE